MGHQPLSEPGERHQEDIHHQAEDWGHRVVRGRSEGAGKAGEGAVYQHNPGDREG